MKFNSSLLTLLLFPACLLATAQERDLIIYNACVYSTVGASLRDYFSEQSKMPSFRIDAEGKVSTGNMRGYQAIWEIKDNKLYLCGIIGWVKEGKEMKQANIEELFRDRYKDGRVDASWFSGKLLLADGKWIRPEGSIEPFPKKEIELTIVSGKIVQIQTKNYNQKK
jgi:hypothetical protein